ncbi:MAG TPA: DUF1801 domain-containing protein [Chitinophagaceae bacterium]|jgi:hypothetical protein|nr:DUF1801 domain-containing protein [Chitinophagaceae bacterium]
MAELKTKENEASVEKFINSISDEQKRKDAFAILEMIKQAIKIEPKMWGGSIIGFGSYHYKYASGHEGDSCLIGFSPRKQNISLYLPGGHEAYSAELKRLGKHKTGKGCLYINKLADIDSVALKDIFKKAAQRAKSK